MVKRVVGVFLVLLAPWYVLAAKDDAPFADIHVHFNWTQKSITSVQDVSNILNRHNVAMAVVSSSYSAIPGNWRPCPGDVWPANARHRTKPTRLEEPGTNAVGSSPITYQLGAPSVVPSLSY